MNVRFRVVDQRIFVSYDLIGDKTYQVSLGLYENYKVTNNTIDLSHRLKRVSGDVGPGVRAGNGKEIIWDPSEDFDYFDGSAYFFDVRAVRPGNTKNWAWVVGGAAGAWVAGGVAYRKGSTKKGTTIIINVPDPER